jgi:hypothetical protein
VGGGSATPPNVVILQFCRAILAVLTTRRRSSGKNMQFSKKFDLIVWKIIIVAKVFIN